MKRILALLFATSLFAAGSYAQEGMWMLTQIDQLDLPTKGLEIPVEDVYSPDKACLANAILELGGGSASFVSSKGLVVTNHHVAYTALQRASSVESNYLENGFLAASHEEEIQAPGYEARLMIELEDVTDKIEQSIKGISNPFKKDRAIQEKIIELTEAIEEGHDDIEATVAEMYNGKQYILYTYKVFKDIRIVYAPPSAIGNYGGEIDNWMWPRHTGDFSFFRVYVSPEGLGTAYAEENTPYEPEIWLKPAMGDLDDGDFNFIMGYPGFTTRYRSSTSVDWNLNINYPAGIYNFTEVIQLSEELTANDPEGQLKVADFIKGIANVKKNYQGKVDGMINTNFLQSKLDFEKEFLTWANADPKRKKKYADVLTKEKEQYELIRKTKDRDNMLNYSLYLSGTMVQIANTIYTVRKELEKPEEKRQPGISEEVLAMIGMQMGYSYNSYYEPFDKALLLRNLKLMEELPADQQIKGVHELLASSGKSPEAWVEDAFANSELTNMEYAQSLLSKSSKELEATGDPFIMLIAAMYPTIEEIDKANETFGVKVSALRKTYLDGIYEWKGSTMYPDANRTIRFTWGPVKGYEPADGVWYHPFTSLQGVLDKNTGEEPFNAPEGLVKLKEDGDLGKWIDPDLDDVPVAFLNQCDITGGNSGSPVLNGKGEIIGVAFDGNYEAMISDWQYDYTLQRCIAVDMRYVLYVTEKFGKAGFLLEEMGVK